MGGVGVRVGAPVGTFAPSAALRRIITRNVDGADLLFWQKPMIQGFASDPFILSASV